MKFIVSMTFLLFAGCVADAQTTNVIDKKQKLAGNYNPALNIIQPADKNYATGTFKNGVAILVKNGNKLGLIDKRKVIIVDPEYDYIASSCDGLMRVRKGDLEGYIDTLGKIIVPLQKASFNDVIGNGRIVFSSVATGNKKYGIMDYKGNVIVAPSYDYIRPFTEIKTVFSNDDFHSYGLMDMNGQELLPCKYRSVQIFNESGLVTAHTKDSVELRDIRTVGLVLQLSGWELKNPSLWDSKIIAIRKNGKWGFVNNEGKECIPCVYDDVSEYNSGVASFKMDGQWGIMNIKGEPIVSPQYDRLTYFSEGLAVYSKNKKSGVINVKGEIITKPLYDYIAPFKNGYAKVENGSKCGLIDKTGKLVLPVQFSDISVGEPGTAILVEQNNKFAFVNFAGKFITPFMYDMALHFDSTGITFVRKDGKHFFVNIAGE